MLREKLSKYSIILASNSPRRQELLKELDIPFKVHCKEVEEIYPITLKKSQITAYLADLKSKAFDGFIKENELVITSDTIVWLNGKALGKPTNKNEAFNTLQALSGTTHEVITSVSLKGRNFQKIVSDCTEVHFKELTVDEINYYIKKHQPYDKAGAYGIQEWIGFIGVERIVGSYFNVMGLPVQKLYKELMKL